MPLQEEGVQYPRQVPPPFGLPEGWKAIERAYGAQAKTAGQTYIRYASPDGKHKTVGSVKQAIIKDSEDRGLDPDEEVSKWENAVNDEKEAKQKARDEAGFMEGQALEDAIECFRAAHGSLTGAVVCNLPGWRGESKMLENCGQNVAMYYSPAGWKYPLLKNIEAHFGRRIQLGLEVPDFEAARNSVKVDENGKVINVARAENIKEVFTHVEAERRNKKRKRGGELLKETDIIDGDYQESSILSVVQLKVSETRDALEAHSVANISGLISEAEAIHKVLLERGFAENTQLIYVSGKKEAESKRPDTLHGLSGIFYQRPEDFNGRSYFQKIALSSISTVGVGCGHLFLFWNAEPTCWKIGRLDESLAGIARCFDDNSIPVNMATKWLVYGEVQSEGCISGLGFGVPGL
jgi:hypothetical protein